MNVKEWQERLTDTFGPSGVVGDNILPGLRQEQSYREWVVGTFHGYTVLMDCFFSYYYDTLEVATRHMHAEGWWKDDEAYRGLHLLHVGNFRSMRAADNAFLGGYPLDAVGLLRDMKDRAIFLSAVAQGFTSLKALYRIFPEENEAQGVTEGNTDVVRVERAREQGRVLNLMLRRTSGLSEETLSELRRWEQLFHLEVHGSMLTRASIVKQITDHKGFSLWPIPETLAAAMYMCRVCEVAWMLTRTLPLLQTDARAFGEEWVHKWNVLDDSFRYDIEAFGKTGKQIAYAIIELVERKFPFTPDCFSADNSGTQTT